MSRLTSHRPSLVFLAITLLTFLAASSAPIHWASSGARGASDDVAGHASQALTSAPRPAAARQDTSARVASLGCARPKDLAFDHRGAAP